MYRLDGLKSTRKNPGASRGAQPEIIIGAFEDVLTWPSRDEKGIRMAGDIVMKPNARMYKAYVTASTQVKSYEGDGEEDNINITHNFTGSIPGNEVEQHEFMANWLGVSAFVMYKECASDHYIVIGTPCAPLQIIPNFEANNDKTGFEIEFRAFANTDQLPGFYYGNITTGGPFAVVDAEAIGLLEANGFTYALPASSASTAITVASIDIESGIVTLIGGGGATPATLSNGVNGSADVTVVLKDGTQWVALDGATISLRVINDGSESYLIEENRT